MWMIVTSLKSEQEIFDPHSALWPTQWIWSNYADAILAFPFWRCLKNTMLVTGVSMVGTILSSMMVGYAFARLKFPGRNVLFSILIGTILIPPQVTMIPVFLLFKTLGWVNTFKPLMVPAYLGSAFFIFLSRQFLLSLPRELDEAATIDGAGFLQIWWSIILPLSHPVMITMALFSFTHCWNDFMGPLIYLNDERLKTLALGLQMFLSERNSEWSKFMAISTLMMIPLITLFFMGQKYFVRGIAMSGIKG
jgi:multiple sugar transport system permease protein